MSFLEQAQDGTKFNRTTVTITVPPGPTTTTAPLQSFGGHFVLLNATCTSPCRVRLYTDSTSLTTDAARNIGDYNIDSSVGLIGDIVIDNEDLSLDLNPPLIGRGTTNGEMWYSISSSVAGLTVSLTAYPISKPDGFSTSSVLLITGSNVAVGTAFEGTLTSNLKSFIIYQAESNYKSRLRLYSTPIAEIDASEKSRAFATETSGKDQLIADMTFDAASTTYKLVPPLEGYTWENDTFSQGTGTMGYIIDNLSATNPADISSSLTIYQVE